MKKAVLLILCLGMLRFLFADCQVTKKKDPIVDPLKARQALASSVHIVNEISLPLQASDNLDVNLEDRTRSRVSGINPQRAWWGDSIIINGTNFQDITKENIVHFNPIPVQADSATASSVAVTIPEGARSCFPIVTQSGIAGTTYDVDATKLKIIAKGISLKYIRSIVEDRDYHYIYAAYADSGNPKIAKVDLYNTVIPEPTLIDEGCPSIRPYLSRMVTEGEHKGEICYIRNHIKNNEDIPAVFCFKEGTEPDSVADLKDSYFNDPLTDIVAFDATADGEDFFVANWTEGPAHGHIIHVKRDNTECIDSDWGNMQTDIFNFIIKHRRTGLAAYNDYYYGLAVELSTECKDPNPTDICYVNSNCSCIWRVTGGGHTKMAHYHNWIHDIEVDRDISRKYPDVTKNYFYLMTGVSTLATDIAHDYKGFVDAVNTPPSPIWDSLMLSTNTTSYIVSWGSGSAYRPVNNQNEVVISDNPYMDWSTHWPLPEQDKTKLIKFRIHGWASIPYYLRILDPRDYSGYAPVNPPANSNDNCQSANDSPPGPLLNASDTKNWSRTPQPYLFGFCNTDDYCTPGLMLGTTMPGGDSTAEMNIYLYLPAQYAGDNLMVQMSKLPFGYETNQDCQAAPDIKCKMPVDAYSGVYTSWKRLAYEKNLMFKHGGSLYEPYDPDDPSCTPNCTTIITYLRNDVDIGDTIWIFSQPDCLFSKNKKNIMNPADFLPYSDVEEAIVSAISLYPYSKEITLDRSLQNHYCAAEHNDQYALPFFGYDHCSSSIMIKTRPDQVFSKHFEVNKINFASLARWNPIIDNTITGFDCTNPSIQPGNCWYYFKAKDIEKTYDNAYVLFNNRDWDGANNNAIPYLPENWVMTIKNHAEWSYQLDIFSHIWFKHCSQLFTGSKAYFKTFPNKSFPFEWFDCPPNNYINLLCAGSGSIGDGMAFLGNTSDFNNWSYVFSLTADDHGDKAENVYMHGMNHELAHQFNVDPCDAKWHDGANAWCSEQDGCPSANATEFSIMHVGRCAPDDDPCWDEEELQTEDGIDIFQSENFFGITQTCTNPTNETEYNPGDGAVRNDQEPL